MWRLRCRWGYLFLALRAVKARSLSLADLPDGYATADTGFTGFAVDVQMLAEITRPAIAIDKIPQRCTTLINGIIEYFLYDLGEQPVFVSADVAGSTCRANTGHVQGFTGVDIADANHDVAVHDELLDGDLTIACAQVQVVTVELLAEWFATQRAEETVLHGRSACPVQAAEAPRVGQAQR